VKIGNLEQLGLPVFDPLRPGQTLAFWAVSIAAAIERVPFIGALVAAFEVAAENGRAAHLNGGHDAPLSHGHRRAMLLSISFSVAAEHVRHFQLRAIHGPSTQKC
jgi:fructose-1,6-bisphosphatase/inositol monophosphatase family enzyme